MADLEYVDATEHAGHLDVLICTFCHELSMLPVRIQHLDKDVDCGTVACLECHNNWQAATKEHAERRCPRCRQPLQDAATRGTVDSLLIRLMGDMSFCDHRNAWRQYSRRGACIARSSVV